MRKTNDNNHIQVQEKRIWYNYISPERRDGKKPLIIFLHEGLGCSAQWKEIPEIICTAFNLSGLVYDRYGYGQSEAITEVKRSMDYIHREAFLCLPELLEKLDINEPLILFGHSDGGSIALLFASKYVEKVKAVITEADHVFVESVTIEGIRGAISSFEKGKLKAALEKYHGEKTEAMFRSWSSAWLSESGILWNIEDFLKNIEAPVLAIQGKDDMYGTAEQLASKLRNITGHTEILFLNACGHIPHHQAREKVVSRVKDFISGIL